MNLKIALSGASAKVKPLDRFQAAESALGRRIVINDGFNSDRDGPHVGL